MTREEALNILHNASVYHPDYLDALNMAIKALEQEPILDKISAEIEQNAYPIVHGVNNHEKGMTLYGILQVIDKYKTESNHKRTLDADELLKRISEKAKIPSLSEDTVNGLCGATAIIFDMLNESEE